MKFGDENCQNQGRNSELEIKITHDDKVYLILLIVLDVFRTSNCRLRKHFYLFGLIVLR